MKGDGMGEGRLILSTGGACASASTVCMGCGLGAAEWRSEVWGGLCLVLRACLREGRGRRA